MSEAKQFTVEQQKSLQYLRDAIDLDQGNFALIFAHCSYRFLRDRLIETLLTTSNLKLEVIELASDTDSLLKALEQHFLGQELANLPDGILIKGFENIDNSSKVLTALNQIRESLKRQFPIPIIFWITPDVVREIMIAAPDLESWSTSIKFVTDVEAIAEFIKFYYQKYLINLQTSTLKKRHFTIQEAKLIGPELDIIHNENLIQIDQETTAYLYTLLGITYKRLNQANIALEYYQKAISNFQTLNNEFAVGCVYYFLSRAYYSLTSLDQEYISYISPDQLSQLITEQQQEGSLLWQAYECVQQALQIWQSCGREDAIAWAFLRWQRLLNHLTKWDELEEYAHQALQFLGKQQSDSNHILFLKTQFWLGDALLTQGKINQAKDYFEAITTELEKDDFVYALTHKNLAQIYRKEKQFEKALVFIKEAEENLDQEIAHSYVALLNQKREILFELGRYLEAYKVKKRKQLAEYEYSFKSFIGATRIQPRRDEIGMSAAIEASGRGEDVKKLVSWITGNEHAITVIYGYSGVGKSSLVNAGLIPELKKNQRSAPNEYMQIALRSYRGWQQSLLDNLYSQVSTSMEDLSQLPFGRGENTKDRIFELLQWCDHHNYLVVLIFDQFEEFFFTYDNEPERKQLFDLLGQLTNETTNVNIVFSLRRDYMHFLLGRDQLKRGTNIIDLLSRENSYELRNFSRDEAIKVFQKLTERTSFQPELDLIKAVVDDLIDPVTGRVRPIELQIIGRQLEETAGGITTLAAYQQQSILKGLQEKQSPKTVLVKSYLNAVVEDCGPKENQNLAYQLLFLLTDQKGRRSLKSAVELEVGIKQLGQSIYNVEMVLQILVLSDLVSKVQTRDGEIVKYQLVHDYLVAYVQAIKGQDLEALLQVEIAKRKVAERTLRHLKQEIDKIQIFQQHLTNKNKWNRQMLNFSSVGLIFSIIFNIMFWQEFFSNRQIINTQLNLALSELKLAEETVDSLGKDLKSTKLELEKIKAEINDVQEESNSVSEWWEKLSIRNKGSGARR